VSDNDTIHFTGTAECRKNNSQKDEYSRLLQKGHVGDSADVT